MKKVEKKIRHIYEAGIENMVVLVTTRVDGKNYAMTCSTAAEVSHEPPMLVVSICPERHTHDQVMQRQAFVVNILSVKQKSLAKACGSCSGRDTDKLEKFKIPYKLSKEGLPFIQGCLANIGCRLVASYRHGDHTVCIGEMVEADVYAERTQRHLLLNDMTRLPTPIYALARKIPFLHWIKRRIQKK